MQFSSLEAELHEAFTSQHPHLYPSSAEAAHSAHNTQARLVTRHALSPFDRRRFLVTSCRDNDGTRRRARHRESTDLAATRATVDAAEGRPRLETPLLMRPGITLVTPDVPLAGFEPTIGRLEPTDLPAEQ